MIHEVGWVNPYGANMGDLIARSADAQAHAAEVIAASQARAAQIKGAAMADFARSAGQAPLVLGQLADERQNHELKAQELRARGMDLTDRVANTEQAHRENAARLVGRLAKASDSPEAFLASVDDLAGMQAIPAPVAAHIRQTVQNAGPDNWQAAQSQYVTFGNQFEKEEKLEPGAVVKRGDVTIASNPKPLDVAPNHALIMPGTTEPIYTAPPEPGQGDYTINDQRYAPNGAPIGAPAPPKQATPEEKALAEGKLREINAKLNGTIPLSPKDKADLAIERDKLNAQIAQWGKVNEAADEAPKLTPEALELTAKQFAMTGLLPPMGMGKQGAKVRTDIINKAAAMYAGLDLPSQVAAYKANKDSLVKLQGMSDAVQAFENTSRKNIDLFLEKAKKVPDLNVPLLNVPIRWADGNILGASEVPEYEAARRVAINEIAKVTSNPNLSGQLSDSARKEVESFIPDKATLRQAIGVMNTLKQDMENRRESLTDQIKAVQTRIATPPGGGGGPVTVQTPGGSFTFPTQAAADEFKRKAGIQ